MEEYQLIKRGQMHKNYCEDFLLVHQMNERYKIFAVFDGCSSGIDSHFASALWAKSLKAEMEFIDKEDLESGSDLIHALIYQTTQSLKEIRNALMLSTDEILSTLILLVVDVQHNSGDIVAFGDGMVSINGEKHIIDHDNQPDYLAYYLDKINFFEDYEKVVEDSGKYFKVNKITDLSISTDGINTFEQLENVDSEANPPDAAGYLLNNDYLLNNPAMLSRKCNILKTKFGLVNQDDIAAIRIVNKLL